MKKETGASGTDIRFIQVICFFILITGLLFMTTGCGDSGGVDSGTSSSSDTSPSDESVASMDTQSDVRNGLADLYGNLNDIPLSVNDNPVHLDGHNPLMPFPSDVFAYRDETSPTGVRVKLRNEQFPPQLELIPESMHISALFKDPDGSDCDGFSVTSNVLFEFDRPVDPEWVRNEDDYMARDGEDTFFLLDLTTGEFMPALVMESHFAKDEHTTTRNYVMQVMARKRFEYGRRYMAFVMKNFKDEDGNDFSCSLGFEKAKSQDGSEISNFYEPCLKYLESEKGISRDDILTATIFTTRSREKTVGPLLDMFNTVLQDDFTDDEVVIESNNVSPFPWIGRTITGKMLFRNFRDEDNVVHYTPGFKGYREDTPVNWVPFKLHIPSRLSSEPPYPVCISGTGIVMSKEMMVIWAMYNASIGVASLTVDWPCHWGRAKNEGWDIVVDGIGWIPGTVEPNAGSMPQLLSMFLQIDLDYMSMYQSVKTYFANSDIEGIKDLDTDNISMIGVSLGALNGVAPAACMPDLKGAFFHVASANFTKVLSCGTFLLGAPALSMPEGLTGSWYAVYMDCIVPIKGDLFDGIHFADGFREGVPEMNTEPRPLAMTFSQNDGWVTAEAGLALAETAELPALYTQAEVTCPKDIYEHIMPVNAEDIFDDTDGYGVIKYYLTDPDNEANERAEKLLFFQLIQALNGMNWYDVAGTFDHVFGALNFVGIYYQLDWMDRVQNQMQ